MADSYTPTADAYTEVDVNLVARVEFEHDQAPEGLYVWDEALPYVRKAYRDRARESLSALAAAGRLIPPDADA